MGTRRPLRSIRSFFLDALFPRSCYGCGLSDTYLCSSCQETIALPEPTCPHCFTRLPFGVLPRPCRAHLRLRRLFCCASYQLPPLRDAITDFKYRRAHSLASPLGAFMVRWMKNKGYASLLHERDVIVVPVPSHPRRRRDRGFHPAERLASSVAEELHLLCEPTILTKVKNNPPQAGIHDTLTRKTNVEGVFSLPNPERVRGKTILLVDDVLTTGSTLTECAKTLREGNPKEIWALVLAKD